MNDVSKQATVNTTGATGSFANPVRCTECGHDTTNPKAPKAVALFHWTAAPAFLVLIAIVVVGWLIHHNAQKLLSGSGSSIAEAIEPSFTLADVRAIAEGEKREPSLAAAVALHVDQYAWKRTFVPGDQVLTATFIEPHGMRRDSFTFGWPNPWYLQTTHALYDDAVARTGMRPIRTRTSSDPTNINMPAGQTVASNASLDESGLDWPRPRWSWGGYGSGFIAYRPTPEETGGKAVWIDINTFALVTPIGLVILAWAVPSITIWIINLVRGRRKPRVRGRWIKFGSVALALISIVWLNVASGDDRSRFDAPWNGKSNFVRLTATNGYWTQEGLVHTTLRVSSIHEITGQTNADQQIARALLVAATKDLDPEKVHLALSLTSEAVSVEGESTHYSLQFPMFSHGHRRFMRRSDLGPADYMARPAGTTWDWAGSSIFVRQSTGDPAEPERHFSIGVNAIAMLVLGLWLLWLISTGVCRFIARIVRRRRRGRNQCIACGHALGPMPAAPG